MMRVVVEQLDAHWLSVVHDVLHGLHLRRLCALSWRAHHLDVAGDAASSAPLMERSRGSERQ